jgi:hypothetical protein
MKKTMVFLGLLFLILFEFFRVYLIMPMPGSQHLNAIQVAYFLGINQWIIRMIGYLLVLFPLVLFPWQKGLKEKFIIGGCITIYFIVFYVFTFKMEADKMFYPPTRVITKPLSSNKIPDNKLVIGVVIDSVARAYPIQLIGYHHQVVDTIKGNPIMVTYCTVCRTGRIYKMEVNGKQETFRLVGMDHFNAMFEDATTKSWWRQSNGECIAGPLKGYKLKEIISEQLVLSAWAKKNPETTILQPDSIFSEEYENMDTYDQGILRGELTKRDTASWKNKSWILGIKIGENAKTYDWNQLTEQRIIQDSLPGNPIVVLLENDTLSFHAYSRVIKSLVLNFHKNQHSIRDLNTGSKWNFDGVCFEGKLKGTRLKGIPCYQEFLHSWEFFHPQSIRYYD